MNIKDLLQDDALKALEDQIIMSFEGLWSKATTTPTSVVLSGSGKPSSTHFHNLFDHTEFAITDFIYCRDFYYEIKVEFSNEAQ